MNTYDENLRNTVVGTLQTQALEQKSLKSAYNTAAFALYYAQGATITAHEKLEAASQDLSDKSLVKEQAVVTSNISTNLLEAATVANQYIGQSVSNTAVCASNVQIATNAIARLAGDVCNIFSIINAADFHEDIYPPAEDVREMLNKTAYAAEYTSQVAMDASTLTSEVAAANVLSNAKVTNTQMGNLFGIVSADFNTATSLVAADNATLAAASAAEKIDEGELESALVDYNAANAAYDLLNKDLNLKLKIKTTDAIHFNVSAQLIKAPFAHFNPTDFNLYPVSSYYVILVKESKQLTFSASMVENILLKYPRRYADVTPDPFDPKQAGKGKSKTEVLLLLTTINKTIDYMDVLPGAGNTYVLQDSDGEVIKQGANYVAFLSAVYRDEYKKKINNYDDFLSAPSSPFCFTNKLARVENSAIHIKPINRALQKPEDKKSEDDFKAELERILQNDNIRMDDSGAVYPLDAGASDYTYKLTFKVKENPVFAVAYRCMFLPYTSLSEKMLTRASLKSFLQEQVALERINNEYDPQIAALGEELARANSAIEQATLAKEAKKVIDDLTIYSNEIQLLIDILTLEKDLEIANLKEKSNDKPGFFFNTALAEQVPTGNYTPAKQDLLEPVGGEISYHAFIGPATTDNFGNLLIKGSKYIPVILSVSSADEENQTKYTSALSDFSKRDSFHYEA